MENNHNVLIRFGKKMREMRLSKNYSQEAFADECGLDRSYIGGVERGERNISLKNIEIIANALNVNLSELMKDI